MKKSLNKNFILIILFSVTLLFCFSAVSADNLETNNDLNNDEFLEDISISNAAFTVTGDNFTSVQQAINQATASGDEIILQNNIGYQNGESTIQVNKAGIIINGNNFTIDGKNSVRIFTVSASNVTIKNIKLVNGYSDQGGAIYNTGYNLTIIDSIISNNSFSNNAFIQGGAIHNSVDDFKIINSLIANNSLSLQITQSGLIARGGAIYNSGNNFTIINSTFDNNFISSTHIITPTNGTYLQGGAIYNSKGNNTSVIDSTFINNELKSNAGITTENRNGGAIFNYQGYDFYVGGYNKFINNSAGSISISRGGAIFTTDSPNFVISGENIFYQNNAISGGAAINVGGVISDLKILGNNTFSYNGAGGAIANSYATVLINGTNTFSFNVGSNGGVISNSAGTLIILGNNSFISNRVTANGGAIYGYSYSVPTILYISGTNNFFNNSANAQGGAIYIFGNSTITGENIFSLNKANSLGGAIYVMAPTTSFLINGSNKFLNNSASGAANSIKEGGAIYNLGSNFVINGSNIFENNYVYSISQNKSGGAISNGGANFLINGSNIFNNNYVYTSLTVQNNPQNIMGGAISNTGTNFKIEGENNFSNNKVHGFLTGSQAINNFDKMGGAIYNTGDNLVINGNNNFVNNSAYFIDLNTVSRFKEMGGAIYNTGENFKITGNNSFLSNIAITAGGAIYDRGTNFLINGSNKFSNNSANIGGVIYDDGVGFNINGSNEFLNNSADIGSVIYNEGLNFSINYNNSFFYNDAKTISVIYNLGNNFKINGNNSFSKNRMGLSTGAIIQNNGNYFVINGSNKFYDTPYLIINNNGTNFLINGSNNFSDNTRGIIHNSEFGVNFTINGKNLFDNNTKPGMGGIIENLAINFLINGSNRFSNGFSPSFGGVIYNIADNFLINGSNVFFNNSANDSGGVIYNLGNNFIIYGSNEFLNNSAVNNGGAIYNPGTDNFEIIGSNIFKENVANYGGAIYIIDTNGKVINGSNVFDSNFANYDGGAVYIRSSELLIDGNNSFISNKAKEYGAAVYVSFSDNFTIIGSNNFSYNEAISSGSRGEGIIFIEYSEFVSINGNNTFDNNLAFGQGIIRLVESHYFTINGSNIFSNNVVNEDGGVIFNHRSLYVLINGSNVFKNNVAKGQGGVIYNDENYFRIIGGNYFINNSAEYTGGVITNLGDNFLIEGNNTFIDNYVNGSGGVIYNYIDYNLTITGDNTFYNNSAMGDGGVIYNSRGHYVLIFGNNSFENNTSIDGRGAVIFNTDSREFTIEGNNTFITNEAGIYGGVIYTFRGSDFKILYNNSFIGNSAYYGGAIHNEYGQNFLIYGTNIISDNYAEGEGGAIYNDDGIGFTISGENIIENNVAGNYAGAIYNYGGANFTITGSNILRNNSVEIYSGGAIYNLGGDGFLINGTNEISFNNAVDSGGAIYNSNGYDFVIIGENNFYNNTVEGEGGVIYNYNGGNFQILGNNAFENNSALADGDGYGGVIYNYNGHDFLINGENKFIANVADYAGVIYNDDADNFLINGSNEFISNYAISGAVIYSYHGLNFTINGTNLFIHNVADEDGGVFYNEAGGTIFVLLDNLFDNNTALNGGVFYIDSSDLFQIVADNDFFNNTAINGGVIYNNNGIIEIDNTAFVNNEAETGSVIFNRGEISIYDSSFEGISYFIVNYNQLFLSNNNMVSSKREKILNYGMITSEVNFIILDNDTLNSNVGDIVNLTGYLTDDNGNVIVGQAVIFQVANLDNLTTSNYINGTYYVNYLASTSGNHTVNGSYIGADNLEVHTGLLVVSTDITFLNVTVDDVIFGNNPIANITLKDSHGRGINATVTIRLSNGDISVGYVVNGVLIYTIPILDAGNYTIYIDYLGSNSYSSSSDSDNFTVFKENTILKIETNATDTGVIITVTADNRATGNITVNIDGTEFNATLINGIAIINAGMFSIGIHNFTVFYHGDKNFNSSSNSSSFTIHRFNTTLIIDTIIIDNNVIIAVSVNSFATGTITIDVNGTILTGNVINGVAIFRMNTLNQGNYIINASYSGDDVYFPASNSSTFIIPKINTTLVINVVVNEGNAVINLALNNHATGVVFLNVGGKNYTVNLTQGIGVLSISGLLPGIYNITAFYPGDSNFNNASADSSFEVNKLNTTLNIFEVVNGLDVVITVVTDNRATGNVTINVNGTNHIVNLINGFGILSLNMLPGTYNVSAFYSGDSNFNNASSNSSFTILDKMNTTLNINTVVKDGIAFINVVADSRATGDVTVTIDGIDYTVTLVNGLGALSISNLTPGTHNVSAFYPGDSNFNNASINSSLVIDKLNATLDISVTVDNFNAVITVVVDSRATGDLIVNVGGTNYTVTLVNGVGVLNLNNLLPNSYNVTVFYPGDDRFSNASNDSSFVINKLNTTLNVSVNVDGLDAVISVVGDNRITGDVYINVGGNNYTVNLVNGVGSLSLTGLTPGNYNLTVFYPGDENFNNASFDDSFTILDKLYTNLYITTIVSGNSVTISVEVNSTATGVVTVNVDGVDYSIVLVNGKGNLILNNLAPGNYSVLANYLGDNNFNQVSNQTNFDIYKLDSPLIIDVITNSNNDVVVLVNLNTGATGIVEIEIAGEKKSITLVNGIGSITFTGIQNGNYIVNAVYYGDSNFNPVTNSTNFTLHVRNVILTAPEITMFYKNGTKLIIYLTDFMGNPIANQNISIIINNVIYTRITDSNGIINMSINLIPEIYQVFIKFEGSNDYDPIAILTNITVLANIEGNDLTKYFMNGSRYFVKVLDNQGNLLKNTNVTFNINGVFYNRTTNDEGIAYLSINLNPGNYIITAIHPLNGLMISNTIIVLPTLLANDIVMDKNNRIPFMIKVLDGQGNPFANQIVSINIHGIFYERTTDANGIAILNVNLDPGSYIATTTWNGFSTSNNIIIN